MISLYLTLFSILFSLTTWADFVSHETSKKIPEKEFQKIVKSIPTWNETTKRWYMYSDTWQSRMDGNYISKGKILQVAIPPDKKDILKLFSDENLKESKFQLGYRILYKDTQPICEFRGQSPYVAKAKKYAICKFGECISKNESKDVSIDYFPDRMSKYGERFILCEENYYPDSFQEGENTAKWNFELLEVLNEFKAYKVKVNGVDFFINIQDCKSFGCTIIDIKYSGLERLFFDNYNHNLNKDIPALSFLEENIKNCIKNKNENCISDYLINEQDFKELLTHSGLLNSESKLENYKISKTDWNEIKACANYERLLNSNEAFIFTRGINKICIIPNIKFNSGKPYKVFAVTYPESMNRWNAQTNYVVEE